VENLKIQGIALAIATLKEYEKEAGRPHWPKIFNELKDLLYDVTMKESFCPEDLDDKFKGDCKRKGNMGAFDCGECVERFFRR